MELGQIITGVAHRDAIHVAIAPVVAAVDLVRGQRVIIENNKAYESTGEWHAIVDPFLDKRFIESGQRVFVCLKPNTVTGMRHHWEHPVFCDQDPEVWLKEVCLRNKIDFAHFIEEIQSPNGHIVSSMEVRGVEDLDVDEEDFWKHVVNYLGRQVDKDSLYWTCTC